MLVKRFEAAIFSLKMCSGYEVITSHKHGCPSFAKVSVVALFPQAVPLVATIKSFVERHVLLCRLFGQCRACKHIDLRVINQKISHFQ